MVENGYLSLVQHRVMRYDTLRINAATNYVYSVEWCATELAYFKYL
jgi:hypothetical protein